jgi:outer membrane protein assembly factor BamE (lipoprotein component of BamABCDE complex)
MRASICAVGIALALAGCSSLPTWVPNIGVYKLDVNQGNYITQDQVDKLKVGLTPQQVRLALGTPLLVDPFHPSRWEYSYSFERQGRVIEQRQFTAYFVNDKLARWEGDEAPPPPAEVARAGGGDAILDKSMSLAPKTGDDNWLVQWLKKMGWWEKQ